jgi:hypothetical protein
MAPMPIISTETLASCAETKHTGTAETIAANKNRFIMHQTRAPLTHAKSQSQPLTRGWDSFPAIGTKRRALTDRRAVLKGIAFAKSSNPSKTGRVRRRRECTPDYPQLRRQSPSSGRAATCAKVTPPPTSFSSSPQCAGIAASIGQYLIFCGLA